MTRTALRALSLCFVEHSREIILQLKQRLTVELKSRC